MTFPAKIQAALDLYDEKQPLPAREYASVEALKVIKRLPESDQNDLYKIYQFFMNNLPRELEEEYVGMITEEGNRTPRLPAVDQVYKAIMEELGPIAYGVQSLYQFNHLTEETFNILFNIVNRRKTSATADEIAFAINFIGSRHELTPEVIDLIATSSNLCSLQNAVERLCDNEITITPEIANALKVHDDIECKARALVNLKRFTLLTVHNINMLAQHPIRSYQHPIHILTDTRLLTQENLNQLFAIEHAFLLSETAQDIFWSRIPEHVLTQDVFNQLLQLAQQANPGQLIRHYFNELLRINEDTTTIGLNDRQSTHTASVHRSVSESAKKLSNRYQSKKPEEIIPEIKTYINSLPKDSLKNQAAKNCIERITAPGYNFIDPVSQVSIKQLLAFAYLATEDQENCTAAAEDAKALFIEGLYEIQRGYNLSETGVDQGSITDRPICLAGTFNKIIEKLQSIHPDCQVSFITKKTLSLKLPIVVREEAMHYLSAKADKALTAEVQADGIEVIWDKIKEKVSARIFEEFGSLFQNQIDPEFLSTINSGQYVALNNTLTTFFAAPRLNSREPQAEPTVAPRTGQN
ncbi:MAG: uncharacterized protein K0S08_1568 [Gammaproteobacteria bacterium]|jgi:hypothetical protein|nr:uncharacterized protein [Gammaproteobacteria bacterium]